MVPSGDAVATLQCGDHVPEVQHPGDSQLEGHVYESDPDVIRLPREGRPTLAQLLRPLVDLPAEPELADLPGEAAALARVQQEPVADGEESEVVRIRLIPPSLVSTKGGSNSLGDFLHGGLPQEGHCDQDDQQAAEQDPRGYSTATAFGGLGTASTMENWTEVDQREARPVARSVARRAMV